MVSMELSKKEAKEMGSDYHYGLRISLGDNEIDKLKIGDKEVGSKCMFVVKTKVVSKSIRDDKKGERNLLEFQITDMDVLGADDNTSERWYGDK